MAQARSSATGRILVFLGLTLALSALFFVPIAQAGSLQANGGLYVLGGMWCPGIAALLTKLVFDRSLRGLGWRPGNPRYLGLAYVLPIVYCAVAYGAVWLAGLGALSLDRVPNGWGLPTFLAVSATIMVAVSLLSATGEEIGWRGFLVPELAKVMSLRATALVSGGIWFLWHLPLVLLADYSSAAPRLYAIACFGAAVLGISFLMAWLRLASGSFWPAALLHATHNLWVQSVFDVLTRDTGPTAYLTGEFGAALALAISLAAALVWRQSRRKERAVLTA